MSTNLSITVCDVDEDELERIIEQDSLRDYEEYLNSMSSNLYEIENELDNSVLQQGWLGSLVDNIESALQESGLGEDVEFDENLLARLNNIASNPWKKVRTNVHLHENKINPSDFWCAVDAWEEQLVPRPEIMPIETFLENIEPIKWLIDALLIMPGFSMVAGAPKAGKSCWIRWLLYCITTGRDFCGHPVRQGPVIYHATEELGAIIGTEFTKMINAFGAPPAGSLNVSCGSVVKATFREELIDNIHQYNPVLVIVDTLFDAIQAEDSNAYVEMNREMKRLRDVAIETGTHLMVAHHTPKKGKGPLGSQSIIGATEHNFIVARHENGVRTLTNVLTRAGAEYDGYIIHYNKDTAEVSLREPQSKEEKAAQLVERRVFDVVDWVSKAQGAGDVCNTNYLHEQVTGGKDAVRAAIDTAVRRGLIIEEKGPRGAKVYHLPEG